MKRLISSLTVISLLFLFLIVSLGSIQALAGSAAAAEPAEFEIIASGLANPRGINVGLGYALDVVNFSPTASARRVVRISIPTTMITLQAAKDNTLYESETGALSNGSGQHFFAGKTNVGNIRRGLVAFDLAAEIPAGSTVVSAEVDLYLSKTISSATDVSLHPYLQEWGEGDSDAQANEGAGVAAASGDATWLHTFFDSETWDNQGGNFAPDPSTTTAVSGLGHYSWSSPMLAQDVQSCLASEDSSCGWLVKGNEDQNGTAKRFSSRENPEEAERPKLILEYIAPLPEHALFVPIVRSAE